MKRLKALLQDDMIIAALVFVATWSAIVVAVAIPLSPMF
jgi:hypothetical protein